MRKRSARRRLHEIKLGLLVIETDNQPVQLEAVGIRSRYWNGWPDYGIEVRDQLGRSIVIWEETALEEAKGEGHRMVRRGNLLTGLGKVVISVVFFPEVLVMPLLVGFFILAPTVWGFMYARQRGSGWALVFLLVIAVVLLGLGLLAWLALRGWKARRLVWRQQE